MSKRNKFLNIKTLSPEDKLFFIFLETWGYVPIIFANRIYEKIKKKLYFYKLEAFTKSEIVKIDHVGKNKIFLPVGDIENKSTLDGQRFVSQSPPKRSLGYYQHDIELMKSCYVLEKTLSPFYEWNYFETWNSCNRIKVGTRIVRSPITKQQEERNVCIDCDALVILKQKSNPEKQFLFAVEFERTQKDKFKWIDRIDRYLKGFHQNKLDGAIWVINHPGCYKQIDEAFTHFKPGDSGYDIEVNNNENHDQILRKTRALNGMLFLFVDYQNIHKIWMDEIPPNDLEFIYGITPIQKEADKRFAFSTKKSLFGENITPFHSSLPEFFIKQFTENMNRDRKKTWVVPDWLKK